MLGLSGGITLNRLALTPGIRQSVLKDYSAGILIRHMSEPIIGLQAEVNYSGRGWHEDLDTIGTYSRNLRVIELPVMAAFLIGKRVFRVSIALGPYVSYMVRQTETISISMPEWYPGRIRLHDFGQPAFINPNFRDYYLKDLESRWEFGFCASIGFECHTKAGVFGLRASLSHALTNLFPINAPDFFYNASRAQSLQIGILYGIRLQ